MALVCSLKSACIERTNVILSATLAMCGSRSLIHWPLSPRWRNFAHGPSVLPRLLNCVGSIGSANFLPFSATRRGL